MKAGSAAAMILGSVFLMLFALLVFPAPPWPAAEPVSPAIGTALWQDRSYEVLLQGMIILAGVLSILLLLGLHPPRRMPP